MSNVKRSFRIFILAVTLGSSLIVPVAGAQSAPERRESITASPSSTRFSSDAGTAERGKMVVINDGEVAYDFIVYARPYSVSNEQYDPNFSAIKANTNIHKWVQFDKTKYRLEAGGKVTVEYTLRVPQNAAPGGHYGVLFAETQQTKLDATGVIRQKRVGNLIYATVNGKTETGGRLQEFILPKWQTSSPMISSARIQNTGNIDFEASVSTVAKDLFGRTKYTYTGDPVVLPETTRLAGMQWDKAPNFGLFKVEQKVSFLDQKHSNNGYVLIAPRWFALLAAVAVVGGVGYAVHKRRSSRR